MLDCAAAWRPRSLILTVGPYLPTGNQRIQRRPFLPPENQLLASTGPGPLARVPCSRLGRWQLSSYRTFKRRVSNQATSLIFNLCRRKGDHRPLSQGFVSALISSTLHLRNLGHCAYGPTNCKDVTVVPRAWQLNPTLRTTCWAHAQMSYSKRAFLGRTRGGTHPS